MGRSIPRIDTAPDAPTGFDGRAGGGVARRPRHRAAAAAAVDEAPGRPLQLHVPSRRCRRSRPRGAPAAAGRAASDGPRHAPGVHGDLGAVADAGARAGAVGVHRRRGRDRRSVLRHGLGRGTLAVHRSRDERAPPDRAGARPHGSVVHRHARRAPQPRSRRHRAGRAWQAHLLRRSTVAPVVRVVERVEGPRAPRRRPPLRVPRGQPARTDQGDRGARRLRAAQLSGDERRAHRSGRRLGDLHPRRPAGRPRLLHQRMGGESRRRQPRRPAHRPVRVLRA